jgi:beta-galactosidase/beta-glucuronidase
MNTPSLAPRLLCLVLMGSTLLGAAEPAPAHWPLQNRPGPTGNPGQDPATFPKSSVPPQAPQRRAMPPRPVFTDTGDGNLVLSGGWKLQSFAQVAGTIREISLPGFDSTAWYDATVPGTVLTTLVDQGVYPEPTHGLNNMAIPESLAREDWWYRTEFTLTAEQAARTLTLTFNGINYAADVWLNGARLGAIRGAFRRGTFDLTGRVHAGKPNALAVRISPPPHPGIPHEESLVAGSGVPNGGSMAFDGPTFFCTEGWDWIPGIRDRCSGLWQDVVLHICGPVVLGDTHVKTDLPLPDTSSATVFISAAVTNRSATEQRVTVRAEFEGVSIEQPATLAAGAQSHVKFGSDAFPALKIKQPRLWWPNGYGAPELYHLQLTVLDSAGRPTESKRVRFGIRHVTYELSAFDAAGAVRRFDFNPSAVWDRLVVDKRHEAIRQGPGAWLPTLVADADASGGITPIQESTTAPFLVIKVNGVPIPCKGGNWGLDEALKRVSREKLEPYFRLHRDANLTMVRNWCGQNTEEVFFELADEYGLMVWSDFWLSTQDWNMEPGDLDLFLDNAEDTIRRFRNHPSIVIWCGRNEGVPPPYLNEGLDRLVRQHDSSRYFQPTSRDLNLLNSGPWVYSDPVNFFNNYGIGFSTELGLPNAPVADAMRAMMPAQDLWPISDNWAYHDWHQAHHGEVQSFMEAMERQFGAGTSLEDFTRKAQLMNYHAHRAMFEGFNAHLWKPSSGRLMWMSHPCWPSTAWQLYTHDYDTNGAYFGAMKACEPLHVQLNLDDRRVLVVNTTRAALGKATVRAELYDLAARRLAEQKATVDAPANGTVAAFTLDEKLASALPLHFVRLTLTDASGRQLSDNIYWQARTEADHRELATLPAVTLGGEARIVRSGTRTSIEAAVRNTSGSIALLVKPTVRRAGGARVLPAHANDGCFTLLPGETRPLRLEIPAAETGLQLSLEGWNATGAISVLQNLP